MFPTETETKARCLVDELRRHKQTLCIAESCTGGLLSALVTDIEGSSSVFTGAYIPYSPIMKHKMLLVSQTLIDEYSSVSQAVTEAMAKTASTHACIGLGITGIAGPGGATEMNPIGRAYIAIACNGSIKAKQYDCEGSRRHVRIQIVDHAIAMVMAHLTCSPTALKQ